MAYNIEPRKVAGVITEVNQILQGKGFNHGEAVIGLTELLGRIIVDATTNQIQVQEMVKVVHSHLDSTIKIGCENTNKSLIQRV
jgi:hypothetical protein